MVRQNDASEQLARSWDANAHAWTQVVRDNGIESRRVATDAAILDAILMRAPKRVLDVGCGEGWLARALSARGVEVVGIDGSAALIDAARAAGPGDFRHISYDQLAAEPELVGLASYDIAVCNFSLFHEHLHSFLSALKAVITADGALVIQTVHPWSGRGDGPYADGWRTETFSAFGQAFREPMPWYFRTLSSWVREVNAARMRVSAMLEPMHPDTGQPLSLLIVAEHSIN